MKQKHSGLGKVIAEMAEDEHRLGLMDDAGFEKVTARHLDGQTPRQTAARLRAKHGVSLDEAARAPLAKEVFDEIWHER